MHIDTSPYSILINIDMIKIEIERLMKKRSKDRKNGLSSLCLSGMDIILYFSY